MSADDTIKAFQRRIDRIERLVGRLDSSRTITDRVNTLSTRLDALLLRKHQINTLLPSLQLAMQKYTAIIPSNDPADNTDTKRLEILAHAGLFAETSQLAAKAANLYAELHSLDLAQLASKQTEIMHLTSPLTSLFDQYTYTFKLAALLMALYVSHCAETSIKWESLYTQLRGIERSKRSLD
ncbi:hypothetical protein CANCADRAFT_105908 [Tortispora caseinolytica NRRL Y-17796]|uniref:Uncharacterized protein n=1 Tax=Tortispora caseinolytica NRRL Y-17796 TaxID=767744 RepID=A0A1E4TFA7_9ASCO|nr:hypothetical protein CANCADRAFT_105908 [Tortispora caseinolytica NRRL Y-17796]